ncbi:hypothetical protein [Nonomuraea cypriaca]|uniref:hypothetical protein n=1 Tax=Nonomuraea cypriaca TaxID=1187855 RepID=UPI001F3B186E|nr:hypothetical protein [Nonomuraea cypriaca]
MATATAVEAFAFWRAILADLADLAVVTLTDLPVVAAVAAFAVEVRAESPVVAA